MVRVDVVIILNTISKRQDGLGFIGKNGYIFHDSSRCIEVPIGGAYAHMFEDLLQVISYNRWWLDTVNVIALRLETTKRHFSQMLTTRFPALCTFIVNKFEHVEVRLGPCKEGMLGPGSCIVEETAGLVQGRPLVNTHTDTHTNTHTHTGLKTLLSHNFLVRLYKQDLSPYFLKGDGGVISLSAGLLVVWILNGSG